MVRKVLAEHREQSALKVLQVRKVLKVCKDMMVLKELQVRKVLLEHKAFKAYKPPTKPPKTRLHELYNMIEPLNMELKMEQLAVRYDEHKEEIAKAKREMKREKLFYV